MKLLTVFKFFFATLSVLVLSGCLPAQKTTQCGSDEAFNATRRTCVPVVGAASTSTVFIKSKFPENSYTTSINSAAQDHSIAVSDVYNYGFTRKWFIHYTVNSTNNTVQVAGDTDTYSFDPAMLFGAGNYVLEAVIYNDNGENLDSVSWNLVVNGDEVPTLINPIPTASSYSVPSNITSSGFSLGLDNNDGLSGDFTWLVNGTPSLWGTFNGSTTGFAETINPQSLGTGIHTVELKLADSTDPLNIYDSYVWIVNVVDPDLPVLVGADPGHNFTILAIDSQAYGSANGGFFYDHDNDKGTALVNLANKTQTGNTPGLCVTVDNWDNDGDSAADAYLRFDVNGAQMGPDMDITSLETCLSPLDTQALTNSEVGVSKTITVSVYEKATNNLIQQRQWAMNVLPVNSAPVIRISDNTDSFGCTKNSQVYHTACSATQSVDNDGDLSYTNSAAGDIDNTIKLAIDVLEDFETDYDDEDAAHGEKKNIVYFQIKKSGDAGFQDIDSNSDYTRAACTVGYGDSKNTITDSTVPTGAITTYFCDLPFDAFNANGPIESGDYEIKAYLTDAGSIWNGVPKDSNVVRWEVSVNELQSAPEVQNQHDISTNTVAANESYISMADSSCVDTGTVLYNNPGASADEGDYVILHTFVKDLERDNMTISVRMENLNAGPGSLSSVSSLQSIVRTDDDEYTEIQTCFQVPEWANTTGSALLDVVPTVTDVPDNTGIALNDSNTFSLLVNNVNPAPEFADYAGVENIRDLSLDSLNAAEQTYALAGHPFTLTPPSYTDASVYDGSTVTWQWQICEGDPGTTCDPTGSWTNIPNASDDGNGNETLVWTPSPDVAAGATFNLRICLGDDGDGNPKDCSVNQQSRKTYTNIIVNPAATTLASAGVSSGTELATWYDAANEVQYAAYSAGSRIYVEKLTHNNDTGAWTSVHTIYFESDETSPTTVHDLSIIGDDSVALLIAYRIYESGTGNPVPRVRRIDISDDKLSYNAAGVYDPAEVGDTDMIAGIQDALAPTNTAFAGGSTTMNITFDDDGSGTLPSNGETITFNTANGTPVTFTHGTDWCLAACGDATSTAASLRDEINNDPTLSQEVAATAAAGVVTITGPAAGDFADYDSELAMAMGNIVIQNGLWYFPYADGSNSSRVSVAIGTNPSSGLAAFTPAVTMLSTKANITEVKMAASGASDMVILGQADANAHAYMVDNVISLSASNENLFDLSSMALVRNLSMDLASDDVIYVAGISEDASGDTYLNSAVISADLSAVSSTPFFGGTTNSATLSGIDQVKIAANSAADGSAVIALTANSNSADIGLEARFARITCSSIGGPISFSDYQLPSPHAPTSPKANVNDIFENSAIALSPMYDLTKGNSDDSDGAADNAQPSVFFSFHENVSSVPTVKTGLYNVSPENMTTDETGVSGSYPAFISN